MQLLKIGSEGRQDQSGKCAESRQFFKSPDGY